jgi:predicted nucleic acid-binding protein
LAEDPWRLARTFETRTDTILLDTGPLLTLLAISFLRETDAGEARHRAVLSDIQPEWTRVEAARFSEFLALYPRRLTTTHVLTEAFKLRQHSELKQDEYRFRRFVPGELRKADVREVYCSLEDLSSDAESMEWVCRVGLTDAALLFVSRREGCPILSDDTRLRDSGSGSQVLILNNLQLSG